MDISTLRWKAEVNMWKKRIAKFLALFLVPAGLVAGKPQAFSSGFGETLEQAKQTGFFKWFTLEQTGESPEKGGKQVSFQPTGERFHDLARVNVTVDGQGRIVAAELVLQRMFVESSSEGIFARDITKSFLQTGVNPQDQESIASLVREIDQIKGSSAPVIVHQDAVRPPPPGLPSKGYRVYLGQDDAFQLALPHGQSLSMENRAADKKTPADQKAGGKVLAIAFRGRS
jgi:hypothetical protein